MRVRTAVIHWFLAAKPLAIVSTGDTGGGDPRVDSGV